MRFSQKVTKMRAQARKKNGGTNCLVEQGTYLPVLKPLVLKFFCAGLSSHIGSLLRKPDLYVHCHGFC